MKEQQQKEERRTLTKEQIYQKRRDEKEAQWKKEQEEREKNRPKKPHEMAIPAPKSSENKMMELVCNDRMGGKVRIKCFPADTILMVKKLIALHTGTRYEKIRLQKQHQIYKDHITVDDYEIQDGMQMEMYYN